MPAGIGLDEFEFSLVENPVIISDNFISWARPIVIHLVDCNDVTNSIFCFAIISILEAHNADFVAGFEFCQIKSLLQIVVVQIYFIHKDESVSVGRSWCAIDFSADWRLRIFKMKNETAL